MLTIVGAYASSATAGSLRFNNLSTGIYTRSGTTGSTGGSTNNDTALPIPNINSSTSSNDEIFTILFYNYTIGNRKTGQYFGAVSNNSTGLNYMFSSQVTSAINEINIVSGSTWSGGTYTLWGIK
jgi:hypothetical protein